MEENCLERSHRGVGSRLCVDIPVGLITCTIARPTTGILNTNCDRRMIVFCLQHKPSCSITASSWKTATVVFDVSHRWQAFARGLLISVCLVIVSIMYVPKLLCPAARERARCKSVMAKERLGNCSRSCWHIDRWLRLSRRWGVGLRR